MKKKIILPVFAILSIALILVGTTYAYWKFTYISDKTNIGKSKCLSIELTNQKNEISLNNTYPISDLEAKKLTPYSFTINNTCDTFISYDVNLEMLEGTTMNSKYMAVMINNEHKELLSNLDNANTVMSSSVESRKLVSGSLGVGDSVDYTLRLWIDESVTLSDDAQNKTFTSKIVVTAQPSNYSPKDAGYDTLHDAILANEYQTTPEKAIEKIRAKGEPDLSQTAPRFKWQEDYLNFDTKQIAKPTINEIENNNDMTNLTAKDSLLRLYKEKSFNSNTGVFTIADFIDVDPTTINYNDSNYFMIDDYIELRGNMLNSVSFSSGKCVYRVIGATKVEGTYIWKGKDSDAIMYNLKREPICSSQYVYDDSDKGIYEENDDYGNTYYYRGNIKNNNVYFAGFYWQIVRINGDGSIRLLYNGSQTGGTDKSIGESEVNIKVGYPFYVGYMYGNENATSINDLYSNENDSTIKKYVDNWYIKNIMNTKYSQFLSANAGFCNDRTITSGDGVLNSNWTFFGANQRLYNDKATYFCANLERDLFTIQASNYGNKSLTYPIGLITSDELVFSGITSNANSKTWSYSSSNYWTMSPSHFDPQYIIGLNISYYNNALSTGRANAYKYDVRPVINLKPDVKISGGIGTSNDPFVVDTNN